MKKDTPVGSRENDGQGTGASDGGSTGVVETTRSAGSGTGDATRSVGSGTGKS
jgi:hypothetical protein